MDYLGDGVGRTVVRACFMIPGSMIRLRPVEREDLPIIAKWRTSPEVYEYLFEQDPISQERQERWFEQIENSRDRYQFVIETLEGSPIGLVSLFDLDLRNGRAEWGFYIGDMRYRMGGYAVEAELLLLRYAFLYLNLHRVYCQSFAFNQKVLELHKRFGFLEEGRLREHVYHNGRYEDVVIMGVTKEEFQERESYLDGVLSQLANRTSDT